VGAGFLGGGGVVSVQIYFESPRSMGARVIARIYNTKKARKNKKIIPIDISIASTISGMGTSFSVEC
jgi:hypothetical protein